ncbi:MAG: response regulator transcription factor [Oscillospiraceae bacterium]|jgi:DNA-binding response OmpR family regulator|nr:response regulator transcription factor [Oscillospiraceae bacterium]
MAYKVLMVEDDSRFCAIIQPFFARNGLEVLTAAHADEALALADAEEFDLILLDVGLAGALDGFALCRRIRADNQTVPIMFVTARGDIEDQLRGVGRPCRADDYIIKPYSEQVLLQKSLNLIERSKGLLNSGRVRQAGGIVLNMNTREVQVNGRAVSLQNKQFTLLALLMENAGRVLTREQLLSKVWGYDFQGETRVVDQSVRKLREGLGEEGERLQTVHRVGYKLQK